MSGAYGYKWRRVKKELYGESMESVWRKHGAVWRKHGASMEKAWSGYGERMEKAWSAYGEYFQSLGERPGDGRNRPLTGVFKKNACRRKEEKHH
jgi:hypothetical protein